MLPAVPGPQVPWLGVRACLRRLAPQVGVCSLSRGGREFPGVLILHFPRSRHWCRYWDAGAPVTRSANTCVWTHCRCHWAQVL